jgi:4-hydroxybenzoate polyprenyltransferase
MATDINPAFVIYKPDSREHRLVQVVGKISGALLLGTVILTIYFAICPAGAMIYLYALAASWAVGAPIWFYYEYFYLYRKAGVPGTLELFKHGQQVAVAIWAGLSIALGAFASSDYFKDPSTDNNKKECKAAEEQSFR